MGYRSNIIIYVEETKDATLEQILKGAMAADDDAEPTDYEIGINSDGKRVLCAEYIDYKWYDGDTLVNYWDQILEEIGEEHYLFTKEGEEWDDIIINGSYGNAYPVAEIEYDIDFKKIEK